MRMRAGLAAAGAALLAVAQIGAAGQAARPQATFRSDINYVEVDVVVTDAQGRHVPGLTAADFELSDAGKRQTIDAAHEIDVPIERTDRPLLTSAASIPPDVVSNTATAQGRVYLLLLDDLHTTPVYSGLVQRRAREFVDRHLASNDLAAVLYASGRRDVSQDFTSNRQLLHAAIDGFVGRGMKSPVENRMEDFLNNEAMGIRGVLAVDRELQERRAAARNTFQAIRDLSMYLSSLSGRRKAMLVFSEGVDLEGEALPNTEEGAAAEGQDLRSAMMQAIAAATRANVHIYPISVVMQAPGGIGADVRTIPHGEAAEKQGVTTESLGREQQRAEGTLRVLAEQTGGTAILNTNSFQDGFSRIQRENSTYYLLGYYPTTPRDGKFHRLEVRVTRPGLTVRARAGYHAARTGAKPPAAGRVDDLLTGAVPVSGLPIRVAVPIFKHSAKKARVLLAVDLPSDVFKFESQGGVAAEDLEVVYQVLDHTGKIVESSLQEIDLRLRPESRALVEARGFRGIFPIEVAPGRYQLRVAATTKNGARRGSVFADLVVPDFFKPSLVWSGVSLTSEAASQVPTRPATPETSRLIPVMPATLRTFANDDTLALYAEAYDNDTRAPHAVDVTMQIRDETGAVAFTATDQRASAELAAARGGYAVHTDIPLRRLGPGSYVLTLTARSRASGNATASRDIPFAISGQRGQAPKE